MPRRYAGSAVFLVIAVCTGILPVTAQISKDGIKKIRVVAVRDSSLFTLCPSQGAYPLLPDGVRSIPIRDGPPLLLPPSSLDRSFLSRSRPGWREMPGARRNAGPSGWVDPDLQGRIEKEFRKNPKYAVVDSAEKADLVFLVEGTYVSVWITGLAGRTNVLQTTIAVVVPADDYRRNPANGAALLAKKLWGGIAVWRRVRGYDDPVPASPEALVGQFVGNRKWPGGLPPPCAAWTPPPLSDTGAPRTKPVLAGGGSGRGGSPGSAGNAPAEDATIRVNVALVTVPVIASDAGGRYVPDLAAEDFHLYENGVEQRIAAILPETQPFSVALVLDASGSMIFKLDQVHNAALAFVEALRPEDRVMVVSFGSDIHVDSEFTNDRKALRRAILQSKYTGGTAFYDAVNLVVTQRLSQVQGRKAIVLFTDGVDNSSRVADAGGTMGVIEEGNVLVYAIQYDTKKDLQASSGSRADLDGQYSRASQFLLNLSDSSGGRLFPAATISVLKQAFGQIADELGHQYTLCYYPTDQKYDGAYRRIRVATDRPDIKIRARTGYRMAVK